jgi:amino acid adenylation domain-containing protein
MQTQTIEGFRLSPQQKRLWLLQQDSLAYRAQCAIRIEGKLKAEILKEALEQVVNRHEILHTAFHRQPGIKVPIQVIADRGTISWNQVNLSGLNQNEQAAKIEQLFQEQECLICRDVPAERLYENKSLLHSSLLTLSDDQHILLVTLPALCADSWTLKNLVQEISQSYAICLKGEELPDEPVQYIQFSEWQNELLEDEDAENGKAYWHEQNFQSITLPFEAQFSRATEFEPDVCALNIHPDVVANIEALARQHNTGISEFLFACWQTLLWRLTEQSDIFVSTVGSGRKYEELYEVLGLLAKWLPVRCSFQKNLKFSEVLLQISERLREIDQWQDYFVWEEHTESANDSVNFPIGFEFEELSDNYCAGEVSFSIYKQYVCFDRFKVKLSCVRKEESIAAEFHYDTELFDKEAIQCIAEQFQSLVESATNNPEAVVGELNILSARHQLLVEFNNTQTNYPQGKCIHHLFEEQVERTPDKIAVVFEDQDLTYRELNNRANQLAHYLQRLGVKPDDLVGICVERSLDAIVGILGILKAGAAYLPLDPTLPPKRLAFMLQDAQPTVLLTQQHLKNSEIHHQHTVYLDTDWQNIAGESEVNPKSEVNSTHLIYVMFTSGSSGYPKGVAVEHKQLVNYVHSIQEILNLPAGASFATVSTLAADLGNTVIFSSLCYGGCLHVMTQERVSDPQAFGDYVRRHSIDCLKIVPSHICALLTSARPEQILPRQCLILGGEASSWNLIAQIQQYAPECKIINHYGPTETTVGALTHTLKPGESERVSKTVPIGRPIANTHVYLLDSTLQPVPFGVPGELYIGGAGLTRGYLNHPELTNKTFIANPFQSGQQLYKTGDLARYLPDGTIEFLGRVDDQVKIRGFRIELREISLVLAKHPAVRESVVLLRDDEPGNLRLVAYVIPHFHQNPAANDLKDFLQAELPDYMVPTAFVLLEAFPLTPNGKLDRHALPTPETAGLNLKEYVAPQNAVEEVLASIWADLLKIERVGIRDNFFDLGGHSLLATQLISRVRQTFRAELSLRDLFEEPKIANLSRILIANEAKPGQTEKIALAVKKIKTMSAEDKEKLLTQKKKEGSRA